MNLQSKIEFEIGHDLDDDHKKISGRIAYLAEVYGKFVSLDYQYEELKIPEQKDYFLREYYYSKRTNPYTGKTYTKEEVDGIRRQDPIFIKLREEHATIKQMKAEIEWKLRALEKGEMAIRSLANKEQLLIAKAHNI